jgi:hypothetical protein
MTAPTRIRPATEPVFLDRTGRRRRIVVAVGAAATVLLALLLLALLAGLTGVRGAVPGWPAADRHTRPAKAVPHRTEPSSAAAVRATGVTRPAGPAPSSAPSGWTRSPAAPAATTVSPAPATPTTSATNPGRGHGQNLSHSPNPHSSKKP